MEPGAGLSGLQPQGEQELRAELARLRQLVAELLLTNQELRQGQPAQPAVRQG